jgi:benzoate-CoA ligase
MSNLLHRVSTPYDDQIYSVDWRLWCDPEVPAWFDPVGWLLDRHRDTPIAAKAAIVCNDEVVTYSDLSARVATYGNALARLGLIPESRVLMFGTDSVDYITLWLGAVRLGVVPVVISDLYKAKDLAYFLCDTEVSLLFIDVEQIPKLLDIAKDLPASLKTVLVRGDIRTDLRDQLPDRSVLTLQAALSAPTLSIAPYPRHANDLAYMFYSGGTTGTAKGITHLAHDFVLIPERQGHFWEYSANDVVFATSKKYFTHGLWPGVLIPLYWGCTVVLDRGPPTPDAVLTTLREREVTKLITVPTVLKNITETLMQCGGTARFPALQLVISASEKMPPEMFEQFHEITGVELFDSIGSSEITYEWIANRPKAFKRGSLGKPVFGYEIRLISPDGKDVTEPNVEGEAWVKSKTSCFYYWRKYDKSRETFFGEWTRTGDMLTFDESGFFWFAGRNNDLFKVKGLWVSPIEIEAALTRHPAVRECAVVPFDDEDGLTKARAYLVLRESFSETSALLEQLRQMVAPLGSYKIPASFRFINQLPRTALLKIDRKALRGVL